MSRWTAFLGVVLVLFLSTVSDPIYANAPSRFFRRGSFEPVGIDFGVTSTTPQIARMYITRPFDGNPRELVRRDETASNFTTQTSLPNRPNNNPYSDSIAVVPSSLGDLADSIAAGGFEPGDILVTQGLFVYLVRGSGAPQLLGGGPGPTIPAGTPGGVSHCTSAGQERAISSSIVFDRWGSFGGAAIVTCTTTGVWEAWAVTASDTPMLIARLNFLATGRPDITSPNFLICSECIAVVPDAGGTAYFVSGPVPAAYKVTEDASVVLDVVTPGTDPTLPPGRRHALTVPARFKNFGTTGSCLFGTVPADNSILQFSCNENTQSPHFSGAGAGDLLVFAGAALWLVNGLTGVVSENIHPSTGVYEDLSFSPVKKVVIEVGRTSQDDSNPGGQTGKIKFYILTSVPNFTDPLGAIDETTLRFGATGTEDSHVSCKNVGTDVNDDTFPDPQCQADGRIADCDAPLVCILTGITDNPSAFEGGD